MRIFVTVGTHEDPFDRLVKAAEVLAEHGHEVQLQKGTSEVPTPSCRAASHLSSEQMRRAFQHADVVIAHGGPSTLIEASAHGHVPILVPRRASFEEHIDDHQVWFSQRMVDRVHVVEDPADLVHEVQCHAERTAQMQPLGQDADRARAFSAGLQVLCEELVSGRRPRARRRGSLVALLRWMRRTR